MNEGIRGLRRTHYCGDLREQHIGEKVTVFGWVQKMRDLGGLIFIDLRDRAGIIQVTLPENAPDDLRETAASLRAEYVAAVTGTLRARAVPAKYEDMPTAKVEIEADYIRLLSTSETPPFDILPDSRVSPDLRLRHRYLDLRRPDLLSNIMTRSEVARVTREFFAGEGFVEIETPMLIKSTPEGARDYLVPSRVQPGKFYALPQSPQIYKQILMISGFDRYMQIVRCFRDEDLRADRQPEFTQIDLEMSFIEEEDIFAINEAFLKKLWKEILGVDIATPFPRMTYAQAMSRFGSDKPDLRFGFELCNLSDAVRGCGFGVFEGALERGGSVRGINVKGGAKFTRKEIDSLGEFVKSYRAKGLAWVRLADETTSSFLKFMSEDAKQALLTAMDAQPGDLLLIVADEDAVVLDSLGALRCECARRLGLLDPGDHRFLWVTQFPLLERDEEENRWVAKHHPFTAPMLEDMPLLESDPGAVRARAYDVVLSGTEIGGGSIRIHDTAMQQRMLGLLGFSKEDAQARFGYLMEAFKYGAPPHGGIAYGLDRLVMLICGESSIRDVIAFPKVQNASEPMSGCPDYVDAPQLRDLHIELAPTAVPPAEN